MINKTRTTRFFVVLSFFIILGLIFRFALRPFLQDWGSSEEIVEMSLPGDTIVESPSYTATRTILVQARPREVYPWLVQMGKDKAGLYGTDWFNNGFKRSAEEIIPVYQNLNIGDDVKFRIGANMSIYAFKKDSFIVWKDISNSVEATMTWYLIPQGKRESKLVSRYRIKYNYAKPAVLVNLFYEWIDFPVVYESMKGIADRAGRMGITNVSTQIARALLALLPFIAMIIFLVRVFKKENFWEPLYMAAFMLVVFLLLLYLYLPLWVLVIAAFIVLLTLIGTAAETAALKQEQEPGQR